MSLIDVWRDERSSSPPSGPYGAGRRVLVAEDDDAMRALLASILKQDGFEVVETRNGIELLEHLLPWFSGREPPAPVDAIVSDIQMPCFTGMEVLAGLSQVRCGPPVVLITAFGESSTHALARSLGAVAVLDKPFDLDELRTVLCRVIAARPPSDGDG